MSAHLQPKRADNISANPRERKPAFTAGFRIVVKNVADVMRQERQPLILKRAGDNQVF